MPASDLEGQRWKGWVVGALCLSRPHRRASQQDKHKAPTPPLHHPLSLRYRVVLFFWPGCDDDGIAELACLDGRSR
jgi:hypothetical protein